MAPAGHGGTSRPRTGVELAVLSIVGTGRFGLEEIVAGARVETGTWLRIAIIVAVALVLSRLIPRLVRRSVRRLLDTRTRERFAALRSHAPRALVDSAPVPTVRYGQRAEALGTLFMHLTTAAIWLTALVLVLHELQVALVTVVTGAGFVGLAVALGAQGLLGDVIAGFFILLDDRFGVGDRVETAGIVGDIEEVTLRWTRIRDAHGTEWYIPNAQVQKLGNLSQHRGRAVIDVDLSPDVQLADALNCISESLTDLREDPDVGSFVLEAPEVLGVEALSREGPTVRVVVRTEAGRQPEVARAARARVHAVLDRGA